LNFSRIQFALTTVHPRELDEEFVGNYGTSVGIQQRNHQIQMQQNQEGRVRFLSKAQQSKERLCEYFMTSADSILMEIL